MIAAVREMKYKQFWRKSLKGRDDYVKQVQKQIEKCHRYRAGFCNVAGSYAGIAFSNTPDAAVPHADKHWKHDEKDEWQMHRVKWYADFYCDAAVPGIYAGQKLMAGLIWPG